MRTKTADFASAASNNNPYIQITGSDGSFEVVLDNPPLNDFDDFRVGA